MKTIKLIYKLGIVLLLSGCLNIACELKWKPEAYLDQESKDYCLYAKGSYWIYQDSVSHSLDSITINNVDYEFRSRGEGGHKYENFDFEISTCDFDTTLFFHMILTTAYADYDLELLKPYILRMAPFGPIYYHNLEIGEIFHSEFKDDLVLYAKKNNYQINGKTYADVKIFKCSYPNMKIEKIFYWAKHIGLIREEIYKDSTVSVRNLIKYKVKPYNQ